MIDPALYSLAARHYDGKDVKRTCDIDIRYTADCWDVQIELIRQLGNASRDTRDDAPQHRSRIAVVRNLGGTTRSN